MQSELQRISPTREIVAQLVSAGESLSESVAGAIVRRGDEVIPFLIEILEDESLAQDDAPGGGHAPIHAATILRELNATEAIQPMLRVLARCDWEDILYAALIDALCSLGSPALEPALAAYAAAGSDDQRRALARVLAGVDTRDERTYAILLQTLEREVVLGAASLAEYGDPRAVPHLSAKLDAKKVDRGGGLLANDEVIALAGAIERLGGALTEDQTRKLRVGTVMRDDARLRLLAEMAGEDDGEGDEEGDELGLPEILGLFEESRHAKNAPDPGWIEMALGYGEDHLGVSLSDFDADALQEVVFELFPRKVSCEPSAAPEIIRSLRAFWTFAKEDLAHPHAEACLAELGDDAIPRLKKELEDSSNFGMAKSFFMLGRSRGFAVETEQGSREWSEAFNQAMAAPSVPDAAPSRTRSEEKRKKRLRKLKKVAKRRNRR